MAGIRLDHLGKVYDNGYAAVSDVHLDIVDGEFLVLVGPSGCGKSTVLRMVAGLEESTEGRILIDDTDVTDASPKDRDIAMVFQSYALYPHKTVWKNIAYPLELAKLPKDEINARVEEVARILQLDGVLDRRPARLSGGQRQRVAMGRAIVRRPKAFLMDEPLSNLDAKLRVQMRAEIARIQRDLGVTTMYVTHDQVEAMTMGTRVAVLHEGTIQQCASPQTLYDHPANTFVAAFIGSPSMNLLAARVAVQDGSLVVTAGDHRIELGADALEEVGGPAGLPSDGRVIVGVRPEALAPGGVAGPDPSLSVAVELVESLGSELLVHCSIAAETVTVDTREGGEEAITRSGSLLARLEPRAGVRAGDRLALTMERTAAHLFDANTGRNLRHVPTVEAAWKS